MMLLSLLTCYDQLLVVRGLPPTVLQAGLLTHRSLHGIRLPDRSVASQNTALPVHSDEFVQDFHLFPFSPSADTVLQRHLQDYLLKQPWHSFYANYIIFLHGLPIPYCYTSAY